MFEVRKAGNVYRVYDKANEMYVCHTRNEDKANLYAMDKLRYSSFEGCIPNFLVKDLEFGIDLDKKNCKKNAK